MDREALDQAAELVKARPGAAQLCVLHHGEPVLDLSVRCAPDTLFLLWSTGKPLTAMAVHLLAERGRIDLDEPVCRYWPEYGCSGKMDVTVRHVLQHRSGAPFSIGNLAREALLMTDWERSVRAAARAKPKWPAGQVAAYHVLSYGFILGELVQRVDGRPVPEFLQQEILGPAGMRDTYPALPRTLWARQALLQAAPHGGTEPRASLPERWRMAYFNRKALRTAVIPAATVHATARDIARFYKMLLRGGEIDGMRVFDPETVAEAKRSSTRAPDEARPDPVIGHAVRWSHAFQLGWGCTSVKTKHPFGVTASRNVFGHNGSNYCNAWADPDHDLVFVYLTNLVAPYAEALRRQTELSDLIRNAFTEG